MTTWDNSATTRLEWDRLGLLIRSFWFGVTYLRGKSSKLQWSLLLRLVCAWFAYLCLYPREVGPIVADLTLAVTPYQRDSL